jgi:transposase
MMRQVSPRVTALPAEIETIRSMVAQGKSAQTIGNALGRTKRSIIGLVKRKKLGPWLSGSGRPAHNTTTMPDGFAAMWQTMSNASLAKHYGRSSSTIHKWVKNSGLQRPAGVRLTAPKQSAPVAKPRLVITAAAGHKPTRVEIYRDQSPAGLAVTYLRKLSPVYRCNANGRHDVAGKFWLRGHTVLTDADVIERADWLRSRERRVA